MSDAALALWIIAVTGGPLFGGLLLDALFGTRARWWRWWLPPLLPGLLWVGLLIADLIQPADHYDDLGRIGSHLVLAVVLALAGGMSAIGVGIRRWVARAVARRRGQDRNVERAGAPVDDTSTD